MERKKVNKTALENRHCHLLPKIHDNDKKHTTSNRGVKEKPHPSAPRVNQSIMWQMPRTSDKDSSQELPQVEENGSPKDIQGLPEIIQP